MLTWAVSVQPSPISSEYTRRTNWVVVRRATWVYPGLTRFRLSPADISSFPLRILHTHPPLESGSICTRDRYSSLKAIPRIAIFSLVEFHPVHRTHVVIVSRVIKIPVTYRYARVSRVGSKGEREEWNKNLIIRLTTNHPRRSFFPPRFWKRRRKGRSQAARPEISRWIPSPRPSSTSPGTHLIMIYGTGRYSVITSDTRNIGNDGKRPLTTTPFTLHLSNTFRYLTRDQPLG